MCGQTDQKPGGVCTLTIIPVETEDKGVYTARAANPLGEAKCFAHLIVKGAANLTTAAADTAAEDRPVASMPCFTELFADRTAVDGNSTKFECIVTGKPTPKVIYFMLSWRKSLRDTFEMISFIC